MPDSTTIAPRAPKLTGIAVDHGGFELKQYLLWTLCGAGRFAARTSCTESIDKPYAESVRGEARPHRILAEAKTVVSAALARHGSSS